MTDGNESASITPNQVRSALRRQRNQMRLRYGVVIMVLCTCVLLLLWYRFSQLERAACDPCQICPPVIAN